MPVSVKRKVLLAAALISGAAALVTGSAGCLSVKKEFESEKIRRADLWQQQHSANTTPSPKINLTWGEAVLRLRSGNDKVRAADYDRLRADENLKQIRRSLIPQLSLYASYNRALSNGPQIDPFSFASSVFFNVPGLIGYRLRHETAQLVVIRTQLAQEAVWREKVIDLYRAFYRSAEISSDQHLIADALNRTTGPGAEAFRRDLERRQILNTTQQVEAADKISELLGAPGTTFICAADTLPAVGYENPAVRPPITQLGKLTLQLSAVELVGMHARELGVDLQFWPDLNFYITTPSIYSRYGGEDRFWSSNDLFLGSSISWTLDTQGRRKSQKRVIAAETQLRRTALENESIRVSQRIQIALTALAETDNSLAALNNATPPAGSGALQNALSARRASLNNDRREWQLVIWFFDDARWSGVPPLPAPTPALAAISK